MSILGGGLTSGALIGAGLGLAIWLLIVALRPPAPDLARATRRWDRRRHSYGSSNQDTNRLQQAVGARLTRIATQRDWIAPSLRANLRLVDRTVEEHLVAKAFGAATGFLAPTILTALASALGVRLPVVPTLFVALLGAAIGFVLPDLGVADRAATRRADLRRALGCYLDLVAMSLAGGRGIPEALPTAAAVGSGWAFELLGSTVATARSTGTTPWEALGQLGHDTGLPELQDLGSALALVAHDGAKVRESLTARASTQRRRLLAEAEGDAKKANQSMSMAQIVLATGFLLFLGYPAVVNVLSL
jgi:tight adherence protein C